MSNFAKKLILVIGATGAQGIAVIDALLAPASDGSPSPYSVRALTRDRNSKRAAALAAKGVECVEGSFTDFDSVERALKGAYGAWVNTDGFSQLGTLRHYIWSNLDYSLKLSNYNPDYLTDHYNGKGRVADWMKAQPSDTSESGMTWSVVTTGPYMDMLNIFMFGPLNWRKDGTAVFATPIGQGHVPMIALTDVGFFARYSFDNRNLVSTKDLEVASDMVGWDYLVETFKKVTGKNAVFVKQTVDEWFENFTDVNRPLIPVAPGAGAASGAKTFKQNFSAFWRQWRDDVIHRDMEWIRSVNPNGETLESWMRKTEYQGKVMRGLLKNIEDRQESGLNWDKVSAL